MRIRVGRRPSSIGPDTPGEEQKRHRPYAMPELTGEELASFPPDHHGYVDKLDWMNLMIRQETLDWINLTIRQETL
jgi:hypothetical protein